jgi:hypothetical protein
MKAEGRFKLGGSINNAMNKAALTLNKSSSGLLMNGWTRLYTGRASVYFMAMNNISGIGNKFFGPFPVAGKRCKLRQGTQGAGLQDRPGYDREIQIDIIMGDGR